MSAQPVQGMALAVTLILLLVLTLLALSGVRLGLLELRMALDDELRVAAFEGAQSLVDGALRSFNNTRVLAEGTLICARPVSGCDEPRQLALPADLQARVAAGEANVVIRAVPPFGADPPVGSGYGTDKFDAAFLRVEGRYDRNAAGLGQAEIHEGIAIVYGSTGDITIKTGADAETQFSGD